MQLCNRSDLIRARDIGLSTLAPKVDLTSLKTKVDNLTVYNFEAVFSDLGKLSNVVDNEFVKKTVQGKFISKVNAIDTNMPRTS